jgi:Zn-dependent oligopeptidase
MFETRFNKEGLLNPKTGLDYRKMILEPGGSIVIPFLYSNKLNMHFIVKFIIFT